MCMRTKTHDAQAQIARIDGPTRLLGLLALLLLIGAGGV